MDTHVTREGEKIRQFPQIKCSATDVLESASPSPLTPSPVADDGAETDIATTLGAEAPNGLLRCMWEGGATTAYVLEPRAGTFPLVIGVTKWCEPVRHGLLPGKNA